MGDAVPMRPEEYRTYIDQDVLDFIDETNSWYPTDTFKESVEGQRRIYDAMCRAFFNGYPDGVGSVDVMAGNVALRHYSCEGGRRGAAVLYMHGGGNVVGGLESHDDVCADICKATGYDVVSVDYRLSPEFTRSDSFDDCLSALGWVREFIALPVVLVGDSAGGYLASRLAIQERGKPDIAGLVAIYGSFGGLDECPSMVRHAQAPLLSAEEALAYQKDLHPLPEDGRLSPIIPGNGGSLAGLAPLYCAPAECDPISDQSVSFVARARAEGAVAVCHVDQGLVHGHLRARHRAVRAGQSFARVLRAIARLGEGNVDQQGLEKAVFG